MKTALLISVLAIAATSSALAAPEISTVNTTIGKVLTGANDMTLYTFDQDSRGVSSCYDTCAINWPPFIAMEGAQASGEYSLVKRKDGSEQWAQNGMPLYYWAKDKKAGDVTGDGINGVWHAAKP
ncbi:hypothetical protein HBZ99_003876 [Salmonella enterica subsp. enterica]|uniref:Lipoprotein n=1 Tax=Salmonella enterica subsp. enterica serovar Java TaxID=224729 RepID=A0A5X0ZEH0_SALEB|nr:hypothetical protein [Salmonella enterica subsp. enterica serovar Java]ECA4661014.1 hypothetical protein [Salmonella enterica subsp. enterica serovar Cerro]EEP4265484.1 hypothetical protein [Salmonella enterica subsp. enterica serovar Oranienburg]EGO9988843.1 hypothetical protein [Salmonella enterica]EEP8813478.1 hypothetical protein [Salmonella enterica subsp. enterica serovar Oranienburg]